MAPSHPINIECPVTNIQLSQDMQEKIVIYITANTTNRYFQTKHRSEIAILPNALNIK